MFRNRFTLIIFCSLSLITACGQDQSNQTQENMTSQETTPLSDTQGIKQQQHNVDAAGVRFDNNSGAFKPLVEPSEKGQ